MILYGHNRLVAQWAANELGICGWDQKAKALGVMHEGSLVAAAVFSDYSPPDIRITFVTTSPRWASRGTIRAIFRYPFDQLGCKRITAITEATNQRARAFLCRLGFHQEGIHPDAFDSGDAISYGLLKTDAARWLAEGKHGEVVTTVST